MGVHEEAVMGRDRVHGEKGDTWPKILRFNFEKHGDGYRAFRHKHYGIWEPYTWKDYYISVKYLSLGLLSLGFKPEDKALIIGDNAPEWYYAELATQANHGASVGLYSDLTPSEIKYIAEDSEAGFALVEDQEQVDKFLQIKDELPLLKKVIYWNYKGLAHYNDPILVGYREVLKLGEEYDKKHSGIFEKNVESGRGDDVCTIVYTSGTTGPAPKGAVHTYNTMRAGADHLLRLDPWDEKDNVVPYLPPAWINEQWSGIGCHLLSACTLNFAEDPETQSRDTRETGPSIVSYWARLWEGQAAMVMARIHESDTFKRFAFRLLMPIGYRMADLKHEKQRPGLLQRLLYFLADMFLFRSIKKSLGLSNARICYSAGSILSPDAFRFYHAMDLPLKGIYGSTEGGALTGARNDDIRLDTVGPAHEGAEVKVTDKGELIYRQPGMFIGYYRDREKTAEVLKEGWFYSGDSGFIRDDGHIVFTDRVSALLDLASGEKLAPQLIESRLRFSPYIKEAWVLAGPEGAYVSAIVIINYEYVSRWAGQRKLSFKNFAELSQLPEVYELVEKDIARINQDLPANARVKKYINLHREFDPDKGELTRTRKLRRAFLKDRYQGLIEAVYSEKTEVSLETETGYDDTRTKTIETRIKIKSVEGAS